MMKWAFSIHLILSLPNCLPGIVALYILPLAWIYFICLSTYTKSSIDFCYSWLIFPCDASLQLYRFLFSSSISDYVTSFYLFYMHSLSTPWSYRMYMLSASSMLSLVRLKSGGWPALDTEPSSGYLGASAGEGLSAVASAGEKDDDIAMGCSDGWWLRPTSTYRSKKSAGHIVWEKKIWTRC